MNVTPGEASARDALRTDGHYMRRLIEATPIPGGIHAFVSLIAFNDEGDERHSIIRSDEPLSSQTINTLVPNRPAEVVPLEAIETSLQDIQSSTHLITLQIQVL